MKKYLINLCMSFAIWFDATVNIFICLFGLNSLFKRLVKKLFGDNAIELTASKIA